MARHIRGERRKVKSRVKTGRKKTARARKTVKSRRR